MAIVEFEGGARAMLYATRTLPHGHESTSEVIGTTGTLQIGMGAHRDRLQLRDASGVRHRAVADFYERLHEAFDREIADFVAVCRGRKALAVTLADATEATRIAVALTKSLKSGQVEPV
jgi:myo-inositol 2-dehydrogenase/D-chiro-inositol 1-dehydrogenase